MGKRNASMIKSRRSLKSATFHLAGWRLSHPTELPGDLPVPLECHALTLNAIEMQLSDSVADTSTLQCYAQFRFLFINAHFVADNASHALVSSATVRFTFSDEEKNVVIRSGWTPKEEGEEKEDITCTTIHLTKCCMLHVLLYVTNTTMRYTECCTLLVQLHATNTTMRYTK